MSRDVCGNWGTTHLARVALFYTAGIFWPFWLFLPFVGVSRDALPFRLESVLGRLMPVDPIMWRTRRYANIRVGEVGSCHARRSKHLCSIAEPVLDRRRESVTSFSRGVKRTVDGLLLITALISSWAVEDADIKRKKLPPTLKADLSAVSFI